MLYLHYDARGCSPPSNVEPELACVCERCGVEMFSGLSSAALRPLHTIRERMMRSEGRYRDFTAQIAMDAGHAGLLHTIMMFAMRVDEHLRACAGRTP